jgi:hypothetical protein
MSTESEGIFIDTNILIYSTFPDKGRDGHPSGGWREPCVPLNNHIFPCFRIHLLTSSSKSFLNSSGSKITIRGDPGFEDVPDRLVLAHPEGDDKRSVRPFLLDLLSRKHLPPLEIVADLGVDQNGDLQVFLLGKPDIRAALQGCIQILGNLFEYASGEWDSKNGRRAP